MRFKKTLAAMILVLAVVLLSVAGFGQGNDEKVVAFSALIQAVPKDTNYIIINEAKVFLSGTKVASDTGRTLDVSDLKPKLYVTVEAVKKPDGFYARRITVNSSSKIPKTLKNAL